MFNEATFREILLPWEKFGNFFIQVKLLADLSKQCQNISGVAGSENLLVSGSYIRRKIFCECGTSFESGSC